MSRTEYSAEDFSRPEYNFFNLKQFSGSGVKIVVDSEAGAPEVRVEGRTVYLTFDPTTELKNLLFEKYIDAKKPVTAKIPFNYQRVPGPLRMVAHKLLSRTGADEEGFPAWPADASADELRLLVVRAVAEAAGEKHETAPPWPDGKNFAVILSHDMDTGASFRAMEKIAAAEEERGMQSCWNVVGKSYKIDRPALRHLINSGHEISLHGYNHDNKLPFLPNPEIEKRLDACAGFIDEFEIKGFRSPALLVSDMLYDVLSSRFEWSSSVIDTDINSLIAPRRGACTVFPFFRSGILEIPLTIPMDDRLLTMGIEGDDFIDIVTKKIDWIEKAGGVVFLGNHPEPHLSGSEKMIYSYKRILDNIISRENAWFTLPSDLAQLWKTTHK